MLKTKVALSLEGLKAHRHTKEQWQSVVILGERIKRGRVRAELSDPKRTKASFRCSVTNVLYVSGALRHFDVNLSHISY